MVDFESIVGLLLAGGRARRFGRNKLVYATLNETPIGLLAAENLAAVVKTRVVVRGDDRETAALFKSHGYHVVSCADSDLGMGASLAAGVRSIGNARGCIVALADMPSIKHQTIRSVCAHLAATDRIVRPRYGGRSGHPVGFPARYFAELGRLHDDLGGKPVLDEHADEIDYLELNDPGVLRDIDTPSDLPTLPGNREAP